MSSPAHDRQVRRGARLDAVDRLPGVVQVQGLLWTADDVADVPGALDDRRRLDGGLDGSPFPAVTALLVRNRPVVQVSGEFMYGVVNP